LHTAHTEERRVWLVTLFKFALDNFPKFCAKLIASLQLVAQTHTHTQIGGHTHRPEKKYITFLLPTNGRSRREKGKKKQKNKIKIKVFGCGGRKREKERERARGRLSVKDKHAIWHRPDRFGGQLGAEPSSCRQTSPSVFTSSLTS
jgi:hypothetical protein